MTHCLVVQLEPEPIKRKMTEDTLLANDEFMSSVADYVQELEIPYEDAVQAFLYELGTSVIYDKEKNAITFIREDALLRTAFDKFKELVKDCTFEQFRDWHWTYQVKNCIDPDFGTYIYYDYPKPIDQFVRDNVKNNETWYIGGICDYHC